MSSEAKMAPSQRAALIAFKRDQGMSLEQVAAEFAMTPERIKIILERYDRKLAKDVVARVKQTP